MLFNKFKKLIFLISIFSASVSSAQEELLGGLYESEPTVISKKSSVMSLEVLAESGECLSVNADVTLGFDVSCINIDGGDNVVIDLAGFTVNGDIGLFEE